MRGRCAFLLALLLCACAGACAQEAMTFCGIAWGTDARGWADVLEGASGGQVQTGVEGSRIVYDAEGDDPCGALDADALVIRMQAEGFELYGLPMRTVEAFAAGTDADDAVVSAVCTFSCSSESRASAYWETLTAALSETYGAPDVRYARQEGYPRSRSEVWFGAENTYTMAHMSAGNALSAEVVLCVGVMDADAAGSGAAENGPALPAAGQGTGHYEWRSVERDCPSCVGGVCSVCNGSGWYRLYGERVACSVLCSACRGLGVIVQREYVYVP